MAALVSVHDAKESIDPSTLPTPDFSHISNKITIKEPIWIPFSMIVVKTDETTESKSNNRGRANNTTMARVDELKTSFGMGVDTSQDVPAVTPIYTDGEMQYELVYGFGRYEALREMLGENGGWFFNEIVAPYSALEWICLYENEELPKTPNKEEDVVQSVTRLIQRKEIKNTQKAISDAIASNLPFRKKQSRDSIVLKVMERANTPQKYVYYSQTKAFEWKKNHSKDEFIEFGGGYDELRDKYGFLVKEGSLHRFFHNAVKKYALTGKNSYAVLHVGEPTENSDIPTKRANQVIEFQTLKKHYETCGMKTHFLSILGALPQEVGIDNWKELISV